MVDRDDSVLCCCEYVNAEGERSHIMTTFCNCEDLDNACDRLLTWKNVDPGSYARILDTLTDRLRVPWPGGALKVPLDVAAAIALVPVFILLGCFSWILTILSYLVLLPTILFSIHRFIRRKTVIKDPVTYMSESSKYLKRYPRSKFYLVWLVSSVVLLLFIYYTQVITYLKISPYENLVLLIFVCLSTTCLYLVRLTSCAGFSPPEKTGEDAYDNIIESGAWRICGECELQVPRQASHCRTCDTCYHLRDHHCVWLDTCISHVNDRWFVGGLLFGLMAMSYGCHLSLTTVCHPGLVNIYFMDILLPLECPDAFATMQSGLATSAACYGVLLAVLVGLALMQQIVCIIAGVKLRDYRHRRILPSQGNVWSISKAFRNCFDFWWR